MFDLEQEPSWVRRTLRSSNIPLRYLGWSFEDLSPYKGAVMDEVANYSLRFRSGSILKAEGSPDCGKGLLLAGSPGSGKTALASVVAQALVRSSRSLWEGVDRPVFFVTYPDYLLSLQRSFSTEESSLEKTALGAGLLVLDDLGKEHKTASGWSESVFDSLLRLRFDRGLPTLVTTNIPKSRFGIVYGEAMGSFVNECFTTLVVISPDGDRRLHG